MLVGGELLSGKMSSEGTGNECEGFGDLNVSGFSFSVVLSVGGELLSSDEGVCVDVVWRLMWLESLT